jgi:hypothetical protein
MTWSAPLTWNTGDLLTAVKANSQWGLSGDMQYLGDNSQINLTLLNSWTQQAPATDFPVSAIIRGDLCHLRGGIVGGAANTVAFILPVGYRPGDGKIQMFACLQTGAICTRVDVQINGNVTVGVESFVAASYIILENVVFSVVN